MFHKSGANRFPLGAAPFRRKGRWPWLLAKACTCRYAAAVSAALLEAPEPALPAGIHRLRALPGRVVGASSRHLFWCPVAV
jgi:hypothetical protein